MNVSFRNNRHHLLIAASICLLIVIHFLVLRIAPPGFFVDEAVTGAHVQSMLENGTDANGTAWPLFSESIGGGYTTPVYLYPLVAWSAIFGTSEYALRSFSVVVTILAIAILGVSMNVWFGRRIMYATWIIGLLLPWAWLSSYLAWDPVMLPLFVACAWLAFSILVSRQGHTMPYILLFGACLVLGAYVYPPFRVSGPLLLAAGAIYLFYKQHISLRHIAVLTILCAVLSLPLAYFMFQPSALSRSQAINVFSHGGLLLGIWEVIINYARMLSPISLFATGDPNLRHSTGLYGMLGGVGLMGTIGIISLLLRKKTKHRQIILPAAIGIVCCMLGSALTNEGQPHFLRATGAWPLFIILIVVGWHELYQMRLRYFYGALIISSLLTIGYFTDLIAYYPARSSGAFDVTIREEIAAGRTVDYPEKALRYYR